MRIDYNTPLLEILRINDSVTEIELGERTTTLQIKALFFKPQLRRFIIHLKTPLLALEANWPESIKEIELGIAISEAQITLLAAKEPKLTFIVSGNTSYTSLISLCHSSIQEIEQGQGIKRKQIKLITSKRPDLIIKDPKTKNELEEVKEEKDSNHTALNSSSAFFSQSAMDTSMDETVLTMLSLNQDTTATNEVGSRDNQPPQTGVNAAFTHH